jgi:hypothetical protein
MTLSIIESRHPRKLFKYIEEEWHGQVTKTAPGICRITGYPLEIQVIESRKLPLKENLRLKGLRKDLNVKTAGSILRESRKKRLETELAAYLYALGIFVCPDQCEPESHRGGTSHGKKRIAL